MNCMRKLAVAAVMSVSTLFNVYAQDTKYGIDDTKYGIDDAKRNFQVSLYGGLYLNNDAWQVEPSFAWHFHRYIGLSVGVEFTGQVNAPSRVTTISGHEAQLADNERNIHWIIFKPSVVFKSPDVYHSSDNFYRLWFQVEPGLSLACPFHNSLTYEILDFDGMVSTVVDYRQFRNEGLRWFYWNVRASVNFAIDRFVIGAGYAFSDLDYYSCRRNVTLDDGTKFYVPKKEMSHTVFLSLGYKF